MEEIIREIEVKGEEAMERLGEALAPLLRPGDLIALFGELGAGKTCLVRGIARGLGIEGGWVSSPSFSLIHEYQGERPLFHIDCYRLQRAEELEELGLEEYFDGAGITAIEWAERIPDLPEDRLDIHITITDASGRKIRLQGKGSFSRRNGLLELPSVFS